MVSCKGDTLINYELVVLFQSLRRAPLWIRIGPYLVSLDLLWKNLREMEVEGLEVHPQGRVCRGVLDVTPRGPQST